MLTQRARIFSAIILSATTAVAVTVIGVVAAPSATACPGPARELPGGVGVCVSSPPRTPAPAPSGGGGSGGGENLGCPNLGLDSACAVQNAPGPAPVAPATVAQEARDMLLLPTPTIHTSPNPRTYVKLRTGLWVDPAEFRVLTATTPPVDGQVITATATPQKVTWNLVENTVVCNGPGKENGTECGYTYQRSSAGQPAGTYQISATITWTITWACVSGCDESGPLPAMSMTSSLDLPVLEIQTESKPG
jgi:hypothetical protein